MKDFCMSHPIATLFLGICATTFVYDAAVTIYNFRLIRLAEEGKTMFKMDGHYYGSTKNEGGNEE